MRTAAVLGLMVLFAVGCQTTAPQGDTPYQRAKRWTMAHKKKKESAPPAAVKKSQIPPASAKSKAPEKPAYSRPVIRKEILPSYPRSYALPTIINYMDQSLMVRVPEGNYWVPADYVFSVPMGQNTHLQRRRLETFYIDRMEITVAQYRQFDPDYDEKRFTGDEECPECPAMAVTWEQARRYCEWAGKRLPTENEWEAAARGTSQWKYPWGDRPLKKFGNLNGDVDGFAGIARVGSFPMGASPFGAMDMTGNVWEWVSSTVILDQRSASGKNAKLQTLNVVKGGSWRSSPEMASISFRNLVNPKMMNPAFGFRCAKSARTAKDLNSR
ncbi:MAG: SUMF1/EgtB/PvdO family nonheme iron enzyme [Nitrospinaceae bacterium]|nr:formylglycine-generating enzyme family protein [Nitrospinaceae bacterium]NIR55642.1 formylglycine-generating enzyme family protein [Nitrospinaceae bacterium]NIS86084.1 formylglycine-generating enzyme family protein [Nitrospinaceae bacterium]NIT82928.1 formylglycine-generating enzyme family protein [Nitrospinaceae bacterium]NIU45131.1 formylglycine-generating enzyme family protein [Nitrospinaceae bacterium]